MSVNGCLPHRKSVKRGMDGNLTRYILAISWTNMVTTTMLNPSGLNVDTIYTNFHVKKFMPLAQERCLKVTFCGWHLRSNAGNRSWSKNSFTVPIFRCSSQPIILSFVSFFLCLTWSLAFTPCLSCPCFSVGCGGNLMCSDKRKNNESHLKLERRFEKCITFLIHIFDWYLVLSMCVSTGFICDLS